MRRFHVYLAGKAPRSASLVQSLPARHLKGLERQYRGYIPDAHWMPEAPVIVWLSGRNGKVLRSDMGWREEYELCLLSTPTRQPRLKKLFLAAAAAAAVILPVGSDAASAKDRGDASAPPLPPSAQNRSRSGSYECGPPTAALTVTSRRDHNGLLPLLDGHGRPVELGAYHSNVSTHTNAVTAHTNNPQVPHTNVWSNHSNIPTYTIPHTNVVPGDFIF